MTISTSIAPFLMVLEETSDPAVAYFSFATDDTGERGVIRANKEGLRLYAAELLKKSMQMEAIQDGKNICFQHHDWLVNDAGYNLISAVKPEYASRIEITAATNSAVKASKEKESSSPARKGCLGTLLLLLGSLFTIGAAIKCFR
jgi:hypothetical protein